MSAPFDFNAYLARSADEVKRPKPIPSGTYTFLVKGREFGKSSKKETPFAEYEIIPQTHEADVDVTQLDGVNLHEKSLRATFYLTKDAEYRLLDFAKACGVPTQGRKLSEIIDSCVNTYVKGTVKIRPNPEDVTAPGYNDVGPFAPAM